MNVIQDCYPSRVGKKEEILPRRDPVVYGAIGSNSEYTLSDKQLHDFDRDGFLILPDFTPEMVQPLLDEVEQLRIRMAGMEELVSEPESGALRTIFDLHRHSDLIDQFSRHPCILAMVKQILGSDAYIMQSRLNIKPAYKGESFPWHSDFETWHVEDGMPRMRAITGWLMLNENTEFNGPLYVVPGSHRAFVSCAGETQADNYKRSLKKQTAGVPSPESINSLIRQQGIKAIYGRPGTLVFHECNILHGSPDNISPWPRSILMFVYNSVLNKVKQPFNGLKPRPEYLSNTDCKRLTPSSFE